MIPCAIYTRKSTESRLDMRYNSLEAQADACRAYIASQMHADWNCLEEPFVDPGFSGGTLDRPALQRLLQKVREGEIGVVVVHKVDRLTRSLSDFAKLAELFEKHNVSFVSVTQHLDTSTSMGRLSLNVLLSFAQFEREIASERIKEKIYASRQRGLWTGGCVPLGYKATDKKLMIEKATAPLVRKIFERYLELGSVTDLRLEWLSGAFPGQTGYVGNVASLPATVPSRGALYTILRNPIYVGKIRCGDGLVNGIHDGIVDPEVWAAVQSRLDGKKSRRWSKSATPLQGALLGKLFDENGARLTRSHTRKQNGSQYTYYVSAASTRKTHKVAKARIPCEVLETFVAARVLAEIDDAQGRTEFAEKAGLTSKTLSKIALWKPRLNDEELNALALSLVERIDIRDGSAKISYSRKKLFEHILKGRHFKIVASLDTKSISVSDPIFASRNHEGKCQIIRGGKTEQQTLDDGRKWFALLATGKAKDMYEIAANYGVSQATVSRVINKALEI